MAMTAWPSENSDKILKANYSSSMVDQKWYWILQHIKRYIAFFLFFLFFLLNKWYKKIYCFRFWFHFPIYVLHLDKMSELFLLGSIHLLLLLFGILFSSCVHTNTMSHILLSLMFCVCIDIWASLLLDGTGRGGYLQLSTDCREIWWEIWFKKNYFKRKERIYLNNNK